MRVTIEGYTTLTGKPETILQAMKDARIFDSGIGDEDCIRAIQQTAWRCFGESLEVEGTTIEERAESLIRELAAHDMITIEEE